MTWFCGDGAVNPGEECDAGLDNSDEQPDACRSGCRNASCGDGVKDSGEGCDDGNAVDTDQCSNACSLPFVNIVANGEFSTGTTPWSFYTDGSGTFAVVDGVAEVAFSLGGTNSQLFQTNVPLQPNTAYRMLLRGSHSQSADVAVRLLQHGAPYTAYGLWEDIALTPTMRDYSIDFTTPSTAGVDARLMFWLVGADQAGAVLRLDDVFLYEVP